MTPLRDAAARRAAQDLLQAVDGARAVVLATEDGFDIGHAGATVFDQERLAAIVSSFAALGQAASSEVGIGTPRCLVVEATEGRLVIRRLHAQGESLVVVVLTGLDVLLGMVWNALGDVKQRLQKAV